MIEDSNVHPQTQPQTIDDVMALVACDIAKVGVGKTGTNTQQGYKFRPIDEVLNTVGPIMAKHGLAMTVEFADRQTELVPTKSGGNMKSVVLRGVFTYRWKNETRVTVTIGEATDTSDKATNKAMAMAAKYAHVLTFSVPVIAQDDADANGNGKTLNDTKEYTAPATKMDEKHVSEWIGIFGVAKTKEELRQWFKDAAAKANELGDVEAYARLKKSAVEISARLPE